MKNSTPFAFVKSALLILFLAAFSLNVFGQNVAVTDVDGYNPHASAMLDVNSTTKGFLLPRLTAAQMSAIAGPSFGLMVYNTTDNTIYYFNGLVWVNLLSLRVSKLSSPDGTKPDALVVDNNGRIGIGQTSPLAGLHINPNGTGPDSHIRLEYNATTFGNIYYDANGMNFMVRNTGGSFSFLNSLGASNFIIKDNGNIGFGTPNPTANFEVKGSTITPIDSPLFVVKNKAGQIVFAVYDEGVRIYVPDYPGKGGMAGFAVGGRTLTKGPTVNYMMVTPDSVRIWVNDPGAVKGGQGGFAVGGRTPVKGVVSHLLTVTPDSVTMNSTKVRIGVDDPGVKGGQGGFAVGGRQSPSKGATYDFARLTPENAFIGKESGYKNSTGLYNSFIGYRTGYLNTTGSDNIMIGYLTGYGNNANQNILIGDSSGYKNTYGLYNVFLGYRTGLNNLYGDQGVFIGNSAGYSNTSGDFNVFMGYQAGYSNTTGYENVVIGNKAGFANQTGFRNVFLGYFAGTNNTTGNYNIFIGREAGLNNTTGISNLYLGESSGSAQTTGGNNTFVGKSTGGNQTAGSYNVYLGAQSGIYRTKGDNNIQIGYHSGAYAMGDNNVLIGYMAGMGHIGTGNVLIGYKSGWNLSDSLTGSNKLYITNNTTDGTTSLIYGEFDNKKLRFNGNVAVNAAPTSNKFYAYDATAGSDIAAVLGEHNVTQNWGVGVEGVGGYIGVAGYSTLAGGSGTRIGIYGYASGGATNWAGYFSGDVKATGTVYAYAGVYSTSDLNLKKNIQQLKNPLQQLLLIRGVTFEWKDDIDDKNSKESLKDANGKENEQVLRKREFPKGQQIGVIAQEVEKVFPEMVRTDADGEKSVNYSALIPVLLEAIKEQQKQIETLQQRVEALEKKQ